MVASEVRRARVHAAASATGDRPCADRRPDHRRLRGRHLGLQPRPRRTVRAAGRRAAARPAVGAAPLQRREPGGPALQARSAYTTISAAAAPWWIAVDGGYFREQGLDVDLVHIDAGAPLLAALSNGELDVTFAGGPSLVLGALQGFETMTIGSTSNHAGGHRLRPQRHPDGGRPTRRYRRRHQPEGDHRRRRAARAQAPGPGGRTWTTSPAAPAAWRNPWRGSEPAPRRREHQRAGHVRGAQARLPRAGRRHGDADPVLQLGDRRHEEEAGRAIGAARALPARPGPVRGPRQDRPRLHGADHGALHADERSRSARGHRRRVSTAVHYGSVP